MSTQPTAFLTPEQYIEIERKAQHKSEYYRGEMFAMAGVRLAHNDILANLLREAGQQLRASRCRILPSDMRVQVSGAAFYTYPDASIVCDEPRFADQQMDTLLNPIVLVEILSPSTERYDRVFKSKLYQTIESLRHYLMIAFEEMQVDLYTWQPDGIWTHFTATQPADVVELSSVNCSLKVADLYERVEFRSNRRS
jgi:Uma2 family endonuclease